MITDYFDWLTTTRGVTPNTIAGYRSVLKGFYAHVNGHGTGIEATQSWYKGLLVSCKPKTIKQRRQVVREFLRYELKHSQNAVAQESLEFLAETRVPLGEELRRLPTEEECRDWIFIGAHGRKWYNVRDRAMLALMYSTLRIHEVADLTMESLRLDDGVVLVDGKRNKQRLVPLPQVVIGLLRSYLKLARPRHGKLFGLNTEAIRLRCNRARDIAGLPIAWTPHDLRRAGSTHFFLRSKGDLASLQWLLGHTSPSTTSIYIRARDLISPDLILANHPLG